MKTANEIAWARGVGESLYKGIDAQKVYDEIVSIGESATPEQIVDCARDETSELHKCFTWDDELAAEKWRRQEARQLRHFLVIRETNRQDKPELRALHFTVSGEGYKTAEFVFQRQDEYAMLLKRAYAEAHTFAEKYRRLSGELYEIFELIDALPA